MLGPVLEELDGEYPDVEFVKVNVDDNMDLAAEYGIMSIPAVYMFRDGEAVGNFGGYRDKDSVREFINGLA